MSDDLPALTSMELLVHGRLDSAVVLPPSPGHPLELWIKPSPGVELFSNLVGRQCGATVQGGRLWLFRPVPLTLRTEDGQTVEVKKMLALDGGPFQPSEFEAISRGGLTVRYLGAPKTVFVVTQGDVVTLPPVVPVWVDVKMDVRPDPIVEPVVEQSGSPGKE